MTQQFNVKDMVRVYIERMNDTLASFNTKIYSHWSDLQDAMQKDFINIFGPITVRKYNYFIVIFNDNWNDWKLYLADDVFELMQYSNAIINHYFGSQAELNDTLIAIQNNSFLSKPLKEEKEHEQKAQSWVFPSQQIKS